MKLYIIIIIKITLFHVSLVTSSQINQVLVLRELNFIHWCENCDALLSKAQLSSVQLHYLCLHHFRKPLPLTTKLKIFTNK